MLCVGVLKLLVKMIKDGGEDEDDKNNESDADHATDGDTGAFGDDDNEKEKAVTVKAVEVLTGDERSAPTVAGVKVSKDDKGGDDINDGEKEVPAPRVTLADLGPLYLPDKNYFLRLSTELYYDNAPWVSDSLKSGKSIQFVHNDISIEDAKLLGCRSLVEKLFEGKQLMGPGPDQLNEVLGNDNILEVRVLLSLLLLYCYDSDGDGGESILT